MAADITRKLPLAPGRLYLILNLPARLLGEGPPGLEHHRAARTLPAFCIFLLAVAAGHLQSVKFLAAADSVCAHKNPLLHANPGHVVHPQTRTPNVFDLHGEAVCPDCGARWRRVRNDVRLIE